MSKNKETKGRERSDRDGQEKKEQQSGKNGERCGQ